MKEVGNKEIKENDNDPTPELYRSSVDNASTSIIEGNTTLGGTALPIVKFDTYPIVIADQTPNIDLGYTFRIYHNLGTANQVFGRYRGKGQEGWQMFPTTIDAGGTIGSRRYVELTAITSQYVTIDFHDFDIYPVYEFQLFFTSMHF